ncbi:MAG: hypothetical protein H6713_08180 [Myxococcales bacterium]|nr:hypothetical protein [Myxococcales bacterium]
MGSGISSVTLARLYIQQGHLQRASTMLSQIVAREPSNGPALELLRRLEIRREVSVTIDLAEEGTALVRWRDAPCDRAQLRARYDTDDAALHVVVLAVGRGAGSPMFVTSRPCTRAHGEALLPCGPDPGSVCACLVLERPARSGDARPIAVAPPMSWTTGATAGVSE